MSISQDSTCDERRLPTRREWIWILIAAAVATALRAVVAERSGFSQDEYNTLRTLSRPVWESITRLIGATHSPLPFLYERIFYVISDDQTFLRLSSALAVGTGVIAIALLAIEMRLRSALAPLLILAVFSPYWERIGLMFRYTMPMVTLATLWTWLLMRDLRRPTLGSAIAATLLGVLTLWTHASANFIGLGLGIFAIVTALHTDGLRLRRLARAVTPLLLALLTIVPKALAIRAWAEADVVSDLDPSRPEIGEMWKISLQTLFSDAHLLEQMTRLSNDIFIAIQTALIVVALVLLVVRVRRGEALPLLSLLLCTLPVIAMCIYIVSWTTDDIHERVRYQAYVSVPLLLLMAVAWGDSRRLGIWRHVYRGALALTMGLAFIAQAINIGDGHREAVQWLASVRRPGEPVAVVAEWNEKAFSYLDLTPMEGITFIDKYIDDEELAAAIREALADAPTGHIFTGTRQSTVREIASAFASEERFAELRISHVGNVQIISFARTQEGADRIADYPPVPEFWIQVETH